MAFRVNQKVVCVDDENQPCHHGDVPVRKDEIYTIRELFDWFGQPGVRLAEITNPFDRGYHLRRFRPIVERKTDISCFKAMLNPSLEDVANLILQEVT